MHIPRNNTFLFMNGYEIADKFTKNCDKHKIKIHFTCPTGEKGLPCTPKSIVMHQTSMINRLAVCLIVVLLAGIIRGQETFKGNASYYSDKLHGRKMSNGQPYNRDSMTCAHLKQPGLTRIRRDCSLPARKRLFMLSGAMKSLRSSAWESEERGELTSRMRSPLPPCSGRM